jgi:membrane protease YdiL (CAAX protease family)
VVGFAALAAASTLAGWGMLALQGRKPGALGWALDPAAVRDSALGFGFGAALILGAVGVLAVAGSVRWVAEKGSIPEYAAAVAGGLGFFLVAAAAEESLLRGYGFQALVQGIGPWPATLLGSAVFAGLHAANPGFGPVGAANIFLAGVLLALLYLRTRSLWICTGVHVGWNWTMSVLHFPVSGLNRALPLYRVAEHGADWWTGGAFGPEAGLPAILVVLAGIAWTLRTRRLGESPRMRALRPLVDARLPQRWPR